MQQRGFADSHVAQIADAKESVVMRQFFGRREKLRQYVFVMRDDECFFRVIVIKEKVNFANAGPGNRRRTHRTWLMRG